MATEVKKVYTLDIQGVDSVNDLKSAIEQLTDKLKQLNQESKEYKDTLKELTDLQTKLADAMNGVGDSTQKASDSLKSIKENTASATESLNTMSDASQKAKENMSEIGDTTTIKALKDEIKSLKDQLYSLQIGSEEYKDVLGQLSTDEARLKEAMNEIKVSTKEASDALKETKDSADSTKESLGELSEASQETKQNLDEMGNVSSVKDLKSEISSLRDQLVSLESGSEEYKVVVQELIADETKLKEVMSAGKNEVNAAEGSYNALSQQMAALKKVWKEVTDEATRNEIGQQIKEVNDKLKEMDYSLGNFQRNVGNYKSALEGLDTEFVSQKRELKELKLAMEQLDPASQAYAEAFQRAAEITHNLAEQQEALKYASTDIGDQLSNIRGIASNLAAGYTAVNAAMGLFGEENENVKEALLKVQQTMALVQGLQGLDGFIKRTQGLSTAMKAWIKTSNAAAAATRADAAASTADAAAKSAEATATAGAVAPQLALNAAMKANPIGFIIGLIATLVTAFALLKDKIMEMIGGNDKMRESFDKIKAVLSGFGNVIKKSIINPIKLALIPLKTLGKVMVDIFSGDWSKIGDDFKAGMDEMKETTIDTINVVGAFKEGYEKKMADIEEEYRKKKAEARAKELDDQIKDLEAQYGNDKKYTEEGKKLYEEYFDAKIAMYDKDSDEYKQAVRDKWEYEREFNEKQTQAAEKAAAAQAAAAKKAADAAKQAYEKRLSDFKSAFSKYLPSGVTVEVNFKDMQTKWEKGLKDFKKWFKKQYKDLYNDVDFDKVWEKVVADYAHGWSDITRVAFENTIKPINDMATKIVEDKALTNKLKEFREGMKFPDDYIETWEEAYEVMDNTISDTTLKLNAAKNEIEKFYEEVYSFIDDEAERRNAILTAQSTDTSYQSLLAKEKELQNQRNELVLQDLEYRESIAKKGYEKEVEILNKTYSAQERYYENLTNFRKSQLALYGDRTEESVEAEQEQVMYELRIANLNKLAEAYRNMAADQQLSAEERKNAEIELQKTIADIEDAEVAHTIACNERRKASWKNALDYTNTAAQGMSTMFGNIATAYEDWINQEVEAGRMSEEEAKKKFETVKAVQKAQTIVNTASAAIGAFQSLASIPYVGPVLGAAAAAAAIAAGAVQLATIENTTWQGNGSTSTTSSSSSSAYQLPSVLTPEPQYTRNLTSESDTDELANAIGDAVGGQKVYVVESDIDAAQKHSKKVAVETTF